jgi:hypothetical protein
MTNYSRTPKPPAARPEPVPNWSKLSRADQVEIYRNGEAIASGKIDMLAMDGSMLWIHQDGANGRALFLHGDGLKIYRRPRRH